MILKLQLILALFLSEPQSPPNYYPGMLSAREASKKSGKDMVIFFSEKTCSTCPSAWTAYTEDGNATAKYISTQVDVKDFDGGIFYDLLNLDEVPAWVIYTPTGEEKERWYGGWKDAGGKPTLFTKTSSQEKTVSASASTNTPTPKHNPAPVNKPAETILPATTIVTSGFVVQAGYFGSEVNASKLVADLNAKGMAAFSSKKEEKNGAMFYRVISSVYSSEKDATQVLSWLAEEGFKGSIKKTTEI